MLHVGAGVHVLRPRRLSLLLPVLLTGTLAAPGPLSHAPPPAPETTRAATKTCIAPGLPLGEGRAEVFRRLNAYRAEHGLRPLRYSKSLELAANEHALDMYQRSFMDHTDPDGGRPADRAVRAGYCNRSVGENIYWSLNRTRGAREPMEAWKNSPGHDANMRRAQFGYVGIGLHIGRKSDGVHVHWVQLFGTR